MILSQKPLPPLRYFWLTPTGSHHALGHHILSLSPVDVFSYFKYNYAFEFLYALAMASIKYSM